MGRPTRLSNQPLNIVKGSRTMPDATDYRKYYGFDYAGIPPGIRNRETDPMFACNDMDDDARRRLTIQRKLPNNVGGEKPAPFPRYLRFVRKNGGLQITFRALKKLSYAGTATPKRPAASVSSSQAASLISIPSRFRTSVVARSLSPATMTGAVASAARADLT